MTLSIYKPHGLTAYGRRRQEPRRERLAADVGGEPAPAWIKLLAVVVVGLIVAFVVLHLAGSGLGALHHR